MNRDDLKRKIRDLKKLERKLRFGNRIDEDSGREVGGGSNGRSGPTRKPPLIWDAFFDLHESGQRNVKYTLTQLEAMDRAAFKAAIQDYFYQMYRRMYEENGFPENGLYDPTSLEWLGLDGTADSREIKKRFRELAKKLHPDHGGDSEQFIELLENYRKLIGD